MRRISSGWSTSQTSAMHWLPSTNLKRAPAWRLKMQLREILANERSNNDHALTSTDLKRWTWWARRSWLDGFRRLAAMLKSHFDVISKRHSQSPQQRIRRGHKRDDAARQAYRQGLQNAGQLQRHRRSAAVQTHSPSDLTICFCPTLVSRHHQP